MVQALSGEEGNLIRCEVEADIVATEPWYSQDYGILTQFGDEHQNFFLMPLDS